MALERRGSALVAALVLITAVMSGDRTTAAPAAAGAPEKGTTFETGARGEAGSRRAHLVAPDGRYHAASEAVRRFPK